MINPAALATELDVPLDEMYGQIWDMMSEYGEDVVISDGLVTDRAANIIRDRYAEDEYDA